MRTSAGFWRVAWRTPAGSAPVRLAAAAGGRDVELVLGLAWHTILGSDLRRQAQRRARAQRATHYVHAAGRSESVGTVRLPAARRRAPREAHSAAQLFAHAAGAGAHLQAFALDDGRCWVVQTRDARVLAGGDVLVDPAAVHGLVARFQERFGAPGSVHGSPAPTWLAELAAGCGPASLLQPSTAARTQVLAWTVGAALVTLGAWQGSDRFVGPPPNPVADVRGDVQDPMAATPTGLARPASEPAPGLPALPSGPDVEGLARAWTAVVQLPLRPAGWQLHRVQCRFDTRIPSLEASGWQCDADYARSAPQASATALAHAGLPGSLRWPALDAAIATFVVPAAAHPRRLADLSQHLPGVITDADALHAIRPAFVGVEVGALGAVPPEPTLATEPSPAPRLEQRSVRLRGPLRSLTLIDEPLTQRIVWQRLDVSFEPGAAADVDSSVIAVELSGVSYATAS